MVRDPEGRDEIEFQGGGLALGPFRLSKLGMAPVLVPFRAEWAPLEGPEDRKFDAGPSRDLNSDSLSWFEPPFGESKKKTSKCEHSKNQEKNHAVNRPKMHVV